jgi:hypothetical protein
MGGLSLNVLLSRQIAATAFIYKKSSVTRTIMNRWYELACDYKNIDDSHSSITIEYFSEHRHDQSIFSLLLKRYGYYPLGYELSTWASGQSEPSICPIWDARNGTGLSVLKPSSS